MHVYSLCIKKSTTEMSEKKTKYYNKVFSVIFQVDLDVVVPASSSSTVTKHSFPAATYVPQVHQKVQKLKKKKSGDANL